MLVVLCWLLVQQTPAPPQSTWVDGPPAPESTVPVPPAVAPRDGEAGKTPPLETLVVPPVPPEDARVAASDDLFVDLADARLSTSFLRAELQRQAALDLDSFLDRALVPGLVWLPRSAGRSLPTSRGHRFADIAVVVDDVPLIDGSLTESLSLLAPARLAFRAGPRTLSPAPASLGGAFDIDTGGSLDDVGETLRVDGLLGAGYGGPDNEKGAVMLGRSGWRLLRVLAHATVLQREDWRTGRIGLGAPPGRNPVDSGSQVLLNTGGVGGSAGARVDVVPLPASRLFLTWQAGRSLDTGDPVGCPAVDENGFAVDCEAARERGSDVVIAGFDVRRTLFGLSLQPSVRLHAQRSVDDRERVGSSLGVVEEGVDNVIRGGGRVAVIGSADEIGSFVPSFTAAVDVFADRYDSQFSSRSLRGRDAEPALGIPDPLRSSFVDDAVSRTANASLAVRADGSIFDVVAAGRLVGQFVDAPAVEGRNDVVARSDLAPAGEVSVRAHVFTDVVEDAVRGLDVGVTVGHVARPTSPRTLLAIVAQDGGSASDSFAEVGAYWAGNFVDVDVVGWGSRRATLNSDSDGSAAQEALFAGLEGRARLRPGIDGVEASLVVAGYAANIDSSGDGSFDEVLGGVLQPQAGLVLRYAPTSLPAGFFLRVSGAVPQSRLSPAESEDPRLCPERPDDAALAQSAPCSGAPGFALVDVGAFLRLGQLRFDAVGENITDTQGTWRNAALGTGGAAVRLRVSLLF